MSEERSVRVIETPRRLLVIPYLLQTLMVELPPDMGAIVSRGTTLKAEPMAGPETEIDDTYELRWFRLVKA